MRHQTTTAERKIAALAALSHGVVTRGDLLRAGVTLAEIRHRLGTGGLIREYAAVYRVGHRAPSLEADYLAAVRACGEGAVLCGQAAGFLYGILPGPPPCPEVLTARKRRIDGVRVRRTRRIDPRDVTEYRAIPVTTVPRTIIDLAADSATDDLALAYHDATVKYRIEPAAIEAVLRRRPNARGASEVRRVVWGDVRVTLSRLEARFLELLEEEQLPLPETNRVAGGHRVDCRWPDYRLTVELDSYRYHSSRHAWEKDRRREREAHARGDDLRRYTWGDVFEDSALMLAELYTLLEREL